MEGCLIREHRTYAHIAIGYGISETRAFENIRFVEDVLVKSKEFSLPGKKALLQSDNEFEVVLVDATESPIQRPKKNSSNSTLVKKAPYNQNTSSCTKGNKENYLY